MNLFRFIDAHSRRLVEWWRADHLRTDLVVDALGVAIWRRRPGSRLIHRTDRGARYTSLSFGKRLSMNSNPTTSSRVVL